MTKVIIRNHIIIDRFTIYLRREFNNQDILFSLSQMIPLSIIDNKRIKEIEALALSGRIRLASDFL